MKKLLLSLLMFVGIVATSVAAIDTTKEYRIKEVNSGRYLNAANYNAHVTGATGGVNVVAYSESDDQIFIFEASGSNYKLKTKSGYYIYCQQWNVDAQTTGTVLAITETTYNGELAIKINVASPASNQKNGAFKVENVSGTYYPFCDANNSDIATWVLEAISNADAPERTISVVAYPEAAGTVTADGAQSVTKEGPITITATAAEGYSFVKWTLNGSDVSTSSTYTDNKEGDKEYVAVFANTAAIDKYNATICKPSISTVGNTTFVNSASISNGQGVLNGTITLGDLATKGQKGAVDAIPVEPGATFNLNLEYVVNWGDVAICGLTSEGSTILYGEYEGSWPSGNPITAMTSDGIVVYNNVAAFPITIPTDLEADEIYVVRSLVGVDIETAGACGNHSEGGYLDFIFLVDSYSVKVSSSDETMGTVYIGEEGKTSVSCSTDGTQTVTLTAVPKAGYEFINWTLNGEEVSTDAVYTTTAVTETRAYVANFRFKPIDPREVKVVSNNSSKGYVTIVSPATTETSIVTGEMVTVKAVAANDDNVFVNWTINGVEVSTEATYTYVGEAAATIQANFATRFTVTINPTAGGTLTVKQGSTTLSSGDRVGEGTTLTITAKGSGINWVKSILVNGQNVMTTSEAESYTATVTVAAATTISAVYGAPACIVTWEYTGNGYVEVWTTDTYETEGADWAEPDGEQYSMWDEAPFESNLAIFVFPNCKPLSEGQGKLKSLTINGDEQDISADGDLMQYGDIFYEAVTGPVHIVAEFDGVSTGVESVEAEATNVYAVAGGIVVEAAEATTVEVYTIAGTLAKSQVVSGVATIAMEKGVYIVKVADKVAKVVVK